MCELGSSVLRLKEGSLSMHSIHVLQQKSPQKASHLNRLTKRHRDPKKVKCNSNSTLHTSMNPFKSEVCTHLDIVTELWPQKDPHFLNLLPVGADDANILSFQTITTHPHQRPGILHTNDTTKSITNHCIIAQHVVKAKEQCFNPQSRLTEG